jgi:hypothetical protein
MRSNLQENFYKRLKQLGGVTTSNNAPASLSNSTLIDYTRASDGRALGIVKENHSYFIKTSGSKVDKLGAEDFTYINGVENKHKYQYNSLAEAEKNRNFFIKTLNESSSKKFKTIAINESENISKAQVNADGLNAGKAQTEADKAKGGEKLKDTAKEKEIASVPSVKAIAVEKEAGNVKIVDATKESSAKAITVDKTQIKPKVSAVAKPEKVTTIKENFGKEEIPTEEPTLDSEETAAEPSLDPAMDAAGAGEEVASAEPELDAAAAALDDMGAGDADATDDAGVGADMGIEGADGSVKDIERLTGKVTQKIRSTELTPEMTKGFIKSYLKAFEDKLGNLDHEDRKELAGFIMKDNDDAMPGEDNASSMDAPEASATSGDEESEIEEAINQHLAEMGIGEDENVENHENIGTTEKPFKNYVAERGYNPEKIHEISLMEMVEVMNAYTNECGDAPDAEGMSNFVTSEVSEKMNECGNTLFEDLMKPFGEKIKANKNAYATESVIPMNEMFGEEEEEEVDETLIGNQDKLDKNKNGKLDKEDFKMLGNKEKTDESDDSLSVGDEPAGEESSEEEAPADEIELELGDEEEPAGEISIAPAADAIAIGTSMGSKNSSAGTKTATVDLNNATISLTMNESEAKLRKIVQKKIADKLAGKKVTLTEGKKSALSAMIDEAINEALAKRRAAIEKRLMRGL